MFLFPLPHTSTIKQLHNYITYLYIKGFCTKKSVVKELNIPRFTRFCQVGDECAVKGTIL